MIASSSDRSPFAGSGLLKLAVLLAAGSMVVAGCGSKPSEKAASDTSKPIVIGVSLPLTGDFSQPGTEAKRGYEVWQKQVNARGGLLGRPVELKIVDDASSQDTVVSDYTKLITQDKVDLVLGTFSSLLNYPASAVAEKNGMVFVEPAGGAPKMFTRGFKTLFFAQQATAPHQADVFVELDQVAAGRSAAEDRRLPEPRTTRSPPR
jgi:branched-chain amino acid transport system substrate-binding protein